MADSIKFESVKAVKLIPTLGIGGFKRFNKKFGVSFEWNFPVMKRENEKVLTNLQGEGSSLEHRVKMGRSTIRVLATYNIPR